MPRIVPAIKGRMGDIDYYSLTLKAGSLTNYIRIPRELAGWENLNLEEMYQREINLKRVKEQLAPYWAENPSHFFGSIIVAPANFDDRDFSEDFEPIGDVATRELPRLYKETAQNIGFLTIPDEIILVPLDGQHRVKAIQFAIDGKDADGRDLDGFKSDPDLANEDISVLLVAVNTTKARSIFTHVNRYAKPTSAGQNYVTSDDDILAVLAREIANEKISARLVKYKTNTLGASDEHFTTLSTIYNCMYALADSILSEKLDTARLPEKSIEDLLRNKADEVWDILLSNIDVFSRALQDKEESGDKNRIELHKDSLLARPVTQECLFRAFLELTVSPTNFSYTNATKKLNALPWTLTKKSVESVWQNVLWTGDVKNGRMITKNRKLASDLIFYLAGGRWDKETKQEDLLLKYQEQFTESERPTALPSL